MRRRFTINDEGWLVDRDGTALGRVCGITLDVPLESPLYVAQPDSEGGGGVSVDSSTTSTAELPGGIEDKKRKDGGAGETESAKVAVLFEHFLAVVQPRQRNLTPGRRRLLLKAVREAEMPVAMQAIDGLVDYAKKKGGEVNLSRVFATRPSGSALGDQIEWWASQAPGGRSSAFLPSETAAEIQLLKRAVRTYVSYAKANEHARRLMDEAIEKLMVRGVTVEVEEVVEMGGEVNQTLVAFSDEASDGWRDPVVQ